MTPSPRRLAFDDVYRHLERFFRPRPNPLVGVEVEWLTFADRDLSARVDPDGPRAALAEAGALPCGSAITFEPGGQLELSCPPQPTVEGACAATAADLAAAGHAVGRAGVRLVGLGVDPHRPPRRLVRTPRYDAMEAHFDTEGPAGRRMMCNTAAVQVNVGLGPLPEDAARQWRLASVLGPTLAAAFANSPLVEGRPTGFRSTRLATWWAIDRARTGPVPRAGDPARAYVDYALAAAVIGVGRRAHAGAGMALGQWMAGDQGPDGPTLDDLDHHLTTLFPPVRPRVAAGVGGWLELRMVDELPDPWWQVPVAVAAVLLQDEEAGRAAEHVVTAARAADRWVDAARTGLGHPALAAAARGCFAAAIAALERSSGSRPLADLVAAYFDRWVDRGRAPADDRLDVWAAGGAVVPEPTEVGSWT